VREDFNRLIFNDDFREDKQLWDIRSDAGSLFLVQSDEYLLKRRDRETEMAALCNWQVSCPSWELKTSLKLDANSDKKGFAGLLFMMQKNRTGGFVVEINMKKQYRIRQIVNGNYKLLTGSVQNKGWVSGQAVPEPGKYNLVRVAYSEKNYDVYLNETLVLSFSELNYNEGQFGFVAGPGSTAYADFIRVMAANDSSSPTAPATLPDSVKARMEK
jgi:hypothetical protein